MWHPEDPLFSDEVVADGARLPRITPTPLPQSNTALQDNKFSFGKKENTDSGFLSGVSIHEDSSCGNTCSSTPLSEEPCNTSGAMKLRSTPLCSDSGLGLCEDRIQTFPNNLSTPISKSGPRKEAPRKITLSDLLRQDEDGDTPLHLAVLQGFIEVVFSLVRILSDPRFLEVPNKKLQSPLHLAVLTKQASLVRRLVVGGASVLQRDRHGNTPLHLACRDGSVDCALALLKPINQEEQHLALLSPYALTQPLPQDLEQRNYDGQLPIHLAAINGHVHIVRLLRGFGANMNAVEGKYGRTALHYAVERRHPALLHYLVKEWGAVTEIETYSGYTAYQLATACAPMLAALLADLGAQQRPSPLEKWSSSDEDDQANGDDDDVSCLPWSDAKGNQDSSLMSEVALVA